MRGSVGIYARVELSDVFDEISDEQLLAEIKDRCLEVARTVKEAEEDKFRPLVEEAFEYLKSGRVEDAVLTLERALYPKWRSPEEAASVLKAVAA